MRNERFVMHPLHPALTRNAYSTNEAHILESFRKPE